MLAGKEVNKPTSEVVKNVKLIEKLINAKANMFHSLQVVVGKLRLVLKCISSKTLLSV